MSEELVLVLVESEGLVFVELVLVLALSRSSAISSKSGGRTGTLAAECLSEGLWVLLLLLS